MPATLLGASAWFWLVILGARGGARWSAVLALLLTSKLFCFLGVLYVLAPRILYPDLPSTDGSHGLPTGLSDQQLAGLLMLIACPVCYVLTGLRIALRGVEDGGDGPISADRCSCRDRGTQVDAS
jgi:putative membrane protein